MPHMVPHAAHGTQSRSVQRLQPEILGEVAPVRIRPLDQLQLPRPVPFLDALFAEDRFFHRRMLLEPDQHLDAVIACEAADLTRAMLMPM